MEDLGAPDSYLTLADGTPVYSSDGDPVGTVSHVLADPSLDVFDGIVVKAGGEHRFVDADQVAEIHERGVVLKVNAAEARSLPQPSANPGVAAAGASDVVPDELHDKLRRAWDRISGKE